MPVFLFAMNLHTCCIKNHTDVLTQADYDTMLANGQQPPNIEVGSFMDVITEGSKQIAAQNK